MGHPFKWLIFDISLTYTCTQRDVHKLLPRGPEKKTWTEECSTTEDSLSLGQRGAGWGLPNVSPTSFLPFLPLLSGSCFRECETSENPAKPRMNLKPLIFLVFKKKNSLEDVSPLSLPYSEIRKSLQTSKQNITIATKNKTQLY